MKNIVKKNQIIITALSIMIAVAGYLNFSGRELSVSSDNLEVSNMENVDTDMEGMETANTAVDGAEGDTKDISDADEVANVAANEGAVGNMDDTEVSAPVQDSLENGEVAIGEAVLTEAQTADFVTKAKLAREQTRAKSKEMLMNMIENDKINAKSKEEAEQKVMKLTENMEMETQVEQLLGAKGFSNCVVSISNDNTDVLIGKSELTEVEKAQVEDIVTRKTGMDMDQIVISTMKNQK